MENDFTSQRPPLTVLTDDELAFRDVVANFTIPLSIGGGIGQSRTVMHLLKTAHLGEVSVTVWPKELNAICEKKNIHVLE